MTVKERQDILSQVEGIIAKEKGDVCHQVAELIRNIQKMLNAQYQKELNYIIDQINMVLAKHCLPSSDPDESHDRLPDENRLPPCALNVTCQPPA